MPPSAASADARAGAPDGAAAVTAAATAREREFFVRLARLLLESARALLGPVLLLCLAVGALWAYGASAERVATAALVLALPIGWRLAGLLARGIFRARDPRYRLVPCDDATARHLQRWTLVLGRLAAAFLPVGWILRVNHYPAGLLDAVWLAYEVATIVALIFLLARRGLVAALAPAPATRLGAATRRAIASAYPVLAVYVVGLLAVHAVGYVNFARFLGASTAYSIAVLLGSALAWKFASYRIGTWNAARLPGAQGGGDDESDEPRRARQRGVYLATLAVSHLGIAAVAIVGLLFAWGLDPRQVRDVTTARFLVSWESEGRTVGITGLDLFASIFLGIVAVLGGRIAHALVRERLRAGTTLDRGTRDAFATAAFIVVATVGGYLALARLQVNLEALKWLGGAIGLGIGFGLQNMVNNFLSGVILLVEKPIRTDDVVEVNGVMCRVERIGTRSTVVVDTDGITRILPNADFVSTAVTNWSHLDPRTRIRCPVRVARGTDPHEVKRILLDVASSHGFVLKKPPPDVLFRTFGESSLDLELCCYVEDPWRIPRLTSDLNYAIDAALRKAGIELALPRRVLELKQVTPVRIAHEPGAPADVAEKPG